MGGRPPGPDGQSTSLLEKALGPPRKSQITSPIIPTILLIGIHTQKICNSASLPIPASIRKETITGDGAALPALLRKPPDRKGSTECHLPAGKPVWRHGSGIVSIFRDLPESFPPFTTPQATGKSYLASRKLNPERLVGWFKRGVDPLMLDGKYRKFLISRILLSVCLAGHRLVECSDKDKMNFEGKNRSLVWMPPVFALQGAILVREDAVDELALHWAVVYFNSPPV